MVLARRRGEDRRLRPARHDPAPAGHRPRAADGPARRQRPPADRRPRPGGPRNPGVTQAAGCRVPRRTRKPEALPPHPHVPRAAMLASLRKISLTQWILIAMAAGPLLGWATPEFAQQLRPLSAIFLRMFQSLI